MWHHKGWFRGGWLIWVFIFLIFSGALGKNGVPGFVFPLILFWVIMSAFSGGKRTATRSHRPHYQPEPPPARTQIQPETASLRNPVSGRVVEPETRSLSGLPAHCRACGGPVDETTVRWRGGYPACGFCGTGLRDH